MNPTAIILIVLLLVGLGVAGYFMLNPQEEDDVDVGTPVSAPPPSSAATAVAAPTTAAPARAAPSPAPVGTSNSKWKCYAGRYGDAYAEYESEKSLEKAEEHYDQFGKLNSFSTSCTLTGDDVACYSLQNPVVFSNFGYTTNNRNSVGQKIAKYYKEYGKDEVARFNCVGGQLGETVFPETASIIGPREFNVDRRRGKYTNILTSPNGLYILRLYFDGRLFLTKGRSNIKTLLDGRKRTSDEEATQADLEKYTHLRFWFSGSDGNIFTRWYEPDTNNFGYNVISEDGTKKHHGFTQTTISSSIAGLTNNQVPTNQHAIVLTDEGKLYVDHGLGEGEESVIYEAE